MADLNPLGRLQEEATCSICLVFFDDPVSLDCGHNFCRACITQCWEGVGTDHDSVSCPQCRETFQQTNLRTNRQLANIVEIAKQLSVQTAGGTEREAKCKEHGEPFKLFCKDDEAFICVICRESRDHRTHKVFPVGEAAQEYKGYLQIQMMTLKEKREDLMKYKLDGEKESLKWLEKTETERQKIVLEFQKLRQFLEEQEQLLLTQLAKLEKEIVQRQGHGITNLSKNISQLDNLICEIEEKYQQPVNEFLKDIKSTLSRCKTVHFDKPVFMPHDLTVQLNSSSQTNIYLQKALTKFKETLPFELRKGIRSFTSQSLFASTSKGARQVIPAKSDDPEQCRWRDYWGRSHDQDAILTHIWGLEACRAANQKAREDICRDMTEYWTSRSGAVGSSLVTRAQVLRMYSFRPRRR